LETELENYIMSNALCITGMSRSGTSLTTSWLEKCGLTVHDGHVLAANPGNPRGHFEDEDFLNFHAGVITRYDPARKVGRSVRPIFCNSTTKNVSVRAK
jgi:hypothetical protein